MSENGVGRDWGEEARGKWPLPPASPAKDATAELAAGDLDVFIEARALWRLVPEWVPRTGRATRSQRTCCSRKLSPV